MCAYRRGGPSNGDDSTVREIRELFDRRAGNVRKGNCLSACPSVCMCLSVSVFLARRIELLLGCFGSLCLHVQENAPSKSIFVY